MSESEIDAWKGEPSFGSGSRFDSTRLSSLTREREGSLPPDRPGSAAEGAGASGPPDRLDDAGLGGPAPVSSSGNRPGQSHQAQAWPLDPWYGVPGPEPLGRAAARQIGCEESGVPVGAVLPGADDDLAGRIAGILRREARRHGIEVEDVDR